MHLNCDLSCVFLDSLNEFRCKVLRRQDACGVTGVDSGKLDVLHNCRNIAVCTIGDSVCLTLCSVVQETVDEDRSVRCNADSCIHVDSHHLVVVNNLHSSSAENVRRTNHYRVTDLVSDGDSFICINSHACFRHRDAEAVHHGTEVISVFCEVNSLRCCT